jgi:hypothetical protein
MVAVDGRSVAAQSVAADLFCSTLLWCRLGRVERGEVEEDVPGCS